MLNFVNYNYLGILIFLIYKKYLCVFRIQFNMISVEIKNISKVFKSNFGKVNITALNNFSLTVSSGTIFGLLGPNGAGKTTLIKILLGSVFPTSGTAKILNEDISNYKVRSQIGYLPENHKFPPFLTGEGVLRLFAELKGIKDKNLNSRIDELLDLVGMLKWKKVKMKKYSKGMMQRLGLAQALVNDPKLIFLDEPTDGIDPIGRKEIRDILLSLKDKGKTIFLNSHLLSEVELVCDRIAMLDKGNLIREGTVEELTTSKKIYTLQVDRELPNDLLNAEIKHLENSIYQIHVTNLAELNSIIDVIRAKGINIIAVNPQKTSLEDSFISIIGDAQN